MSRQQIEKDVVVLVKLIADGEANGALGAELRQQIIAAYCELTDKERQIISGLASDLSMLGGHEVGCLPSSYDTSDDWYKAYRKAVAKDKWKKVLKLLRQIEAEPVWKAFVRAHAYQQLDFVIGAQAFRDFVERESWGITNKEDILQLERRC